MTPIQLARRMPSPIPSVSTRRDPLSLRRMPSIKLVIYASINHQQAQRISQQCYHPKTAQMLQKFETRQNAEKNVEGR